MFIMCVYVCLLKKLIGLYYYYSVVKNCKTNKTNWAFTFKNGFPVKLSVNMTRLGFS